MNRVQLYGRIANDFTVRETQSGTPVVNINVATGYGDRVEFVPVTVWSNQAKIIGDYCKKGDRIAIEGHVTSSENTRNDVKFREYRVTADFVHLVESKPKQEDVSPESFVSDDDIPF
jgi:single-strand DNA-binding protein